jgi:hypothetical protein
MKLQGKARRMLRLRAIVSLAVTTCGCMAFDGTRALVTGECVTPRTGRLAGQLGPWSRQVRAVGIDPRSTLMKRAFAILGVTGLAPAASFAIRGPAPWAWWAMEIAATAWLWYLPFGTLLGLVQSGLLVLALCPSGGG